MKSIQSVVRRGSSHVVHITNEERKERKKYLDVHRNTRHVLLKKKYLSVFFLKTELTYLINTS
jgi:hypothetical protein